MYSYNNYGMQLGVVNKKWWDKLEPSSQKVIRDAAAEAVKYQREVLYPENEKSAYDGFVEGGIKVHTLTDEQMAEFKTLTRPVWDKYLKELPAGLVDMVLETQK
jgi:TRAP-type C4-dicarboxylate transport system substrate-binding protein